MQPRQRILFASRYPTINDNAFFSVARGNQDGCGRLSSPLDCCWAMTSPFTIRTTASSAKPSISCTCDAGRLSGFACRAAAAVTGRRAGASRCDQTYCSEWVWPACSSRPHSVSSSWCQFVWRRPWWIPQPIRAWEAITVGRSASCPHPRWAAGGMHRAHCERQKAQLGARPPDHGFLNLIGPFTIHRLAVTKSQSVQATASSASSSCVRVVAWEQAQHDG
ncbi:hypothetical protein N657DRAFT_21139 [Parathielavia appendiculata]|uniref:SWIM-type domain-containing protein n=1 Tax=Parathielavia appendiculata TaxID=2587402 RepID=A0AAN6U9J8_9PEZI|nr:hypothetical protein N657DRAFT_21139 [Parathielavia appendiculata]